MLGLRAATADASDTFYLPVQTEAVQGLLDSWYAEGVPGELTRPEIPPSSDEFPLPPPIPYPKPRVGLLYWPSFGATRFAHGTFLVDFYTLSLLRAQLGNGESSDTANQVILSYTDVDVENPDSPEVPRDFMMYLLSARPLSQLDPNAGPPDTTPTEDEAYLVTLVDQRYYWQFQSGTGGSGVPDSWASLFTLFFTEFNVTGSVDPVPDEYLGPTGKWAASEVIGYPTAVMFDNAAYATGMRVVVDPDESVHVQRPIGTNYDAATTFHTDNLKGLGAGGLIPFDEVLREVPASVVCVTYESPPRTKTVAITDIEWSSDEQFVDAAGAPGRSITLWVDADDSTTDADLNALATQAAHDWYSWQLAPLDSRYAGFITLPTSGYLGSYELFHSATQGYTRVIRPPLNYGPLFGRALESTAGKESYVVRLLKSGPGINGGTAWAAEIRTAESGAPADDKILGADCGESSDSEHPFVLYMDKAADGSAGNPQVGDYVIAVPDPEVECTWIAIPKLASEGGAGCADGGWALSLSDSSCLWIRQLGGSDVCGCLPADPEGDCNNVGGALAVKMGEGPFTGKWVATIMKEACSGCGGLVVAINPSPTSLNDIISLTLQSYSISSIGSGSGSGGIFTYTMYLGCYGVDRCGHKYAQFVGYSPDACSGADPGICGPTFKIRVTCATCPSIACDCEACFGNQTPLAFVATVDSFASDVDNGLKIWTIASAPEPPEDDGPYECVNGSCQEQAGGQYATLDDCEAACGTAKVCCGNYLYNGLGVEIVVPDGPFADTYSAAVLADTNTITIPLTIAGNILLWATCIAGEGWTYGGSVDGGSPVTSSSCGGDTGPFALSVPGTLLGSSGDITFTA